MAVTSKCSRTATLKIRYCSKTTLTGESQFHLSTPLGIEARSLMMGSKREIAGSLQNSPQQRRLWSWKEDLQRAWNWDRRAVWDEVGLSHCRYDSLVTVWDEAFLRQGHNDQSRQGHQCSETTLTGESRLHISTPLGIEPGSLMTGSKLVVH
jgi:hypothetical protein